MDFAYSLVEACLSQAESSLKAIGGFSPFARYVQTNGQINEFSLSDEFASANSQEINAHIETSFSSMVDSNSICMIAICSDIQFKTETSTGDAILVRIDGVEAQSVDILIPYECRNNMFFYGQMIQQAGSLAIFSRE